MSALWTQVSLKPEPELHLSAGESSLWALLGLKLCPKPTPTASFSKYQITPPCFSLRVLQCVPLCLSLKHTHLVLHVAFEFPLPLPA